ncbi:MAG: hypothetical protein V4617_19125 [Gemmatimonadota bacterium]
MADSLNRMVQERRGMLPPYHRGWADFLTAMLAGDGSRAYTAVRATAELAPYARAWYNAGYVAIALDRPQEALDALDHLDPDRGDMRGWSSYWTQRTHALHLLGAHDRELEAARAMRARFPDRRVGLVLEARALAALGREAAIDSVLLLAQPLPPTTYWSQGAAMVVAAEELIAHGQPTSGRRRMEGAVQWFRSQLAVTPDERGHRYWLASALYHLGQWEASEALFSELARLEPDRLQYRGLAAVAAARTRAPDAERLIGVAQPHERGTHTGFRARVAAARGDGPRAAALFADAVRDGVDGLAWWHATAYLDLVPLQSMRDAMPGSLRVRR